MFSAYQTTLEAAPTHHTSSPYKVAFLTGLSNPRSCALSNIQKHFLTSLEVPEHYKLYLNFPYLPSTGEENEPLWKASLHNTHQFFSIALHRTAARHHLENLASSTDALILITGSCGLEILNIALTSEVAKKLNHVYALGPVAWQQPVYPRTLLQGSSDYLSKSFFRNADRYLDDIHHMNYLESDSIFKFINQHLKQLVSTSSNDSRTSLARAL
jgi:hypothetical protein